MGQKDRNNSKGGGRIVEVHYSEKDASSQGVSWTITNLLVALLVASLAMNIALYSDFINNKSRGGVCSTAAAQLSSGFTPLDRVRMDLHSKAEHEKMAEDAFEEASRYSGERGEGRQGWLTLLKAWDYNNQDESLGQNLLSNYQRLDGYLPIGYTEMLAANWSKAKMKRVLASNDLDMAAKQLNTTMSQWKPHKHLDPGAGCTTLSFATAYGMWNLSNVLRNVTQLNQDIYQASVTAYLKLKEANPKMSATDLNHNLWKLQRAVLDRDTQSYWGGFQDIKGFRELVMSMRHAAKRLLGDTYGLRDVDAERKASHPLVVWVSVHTKESVHQPHVTLDALVGGVYYVNAPEGSGRLELYDPRGKSPLDLTVPEAPSLPPFHRTVGVQPRAGMLVLFPGWLVHSVLPSKMDASKEGYRVSISLNLKGEWQTTGSLSVGCPTYQESSV